MEDKKLSINISLGTIVMSVVVVLLAAFLFYIQDIVLIVLTAIVIASAIEPAVNWCVRHRIPRVIGVILVYVLVIAVFFGLFYAFLPPLLDEAEGFSAVIPEVLNNITLPGTSFFDPNGVVGSFSLQDAINQLQSSFTDASQGVFFSVNAVFGGILSFVLIVVLSFYFAVQQSGIDDFLRVITPVRHEPYILNLWARSKRKIGLWMQGQIILSVIITVLIYLGLTILGVPYALLLAIAAGLFELIPVFGSILAAIPAIIIAFVDGGTSTALLVGGLFLIVNQFQANLIYPLVVKKVVGVPPLLVILALIIGAKLAGFLGVILSVPLAAILQEFVSDLDKGKRRMAMGSESPKETKDN